MHKGLVWFPTVGTAVIAGPSNKELHAGSSMVVRMLAMVVMMVIVAPSFVDSFCH